MVNKIFDMDGVPLYEDPYMEDGKFLRGRKQGSDKIYLIASPKTATLLYKEFIIKSRKDKLTHLNNISSDN